MRSLYDNLPALDIYSYRQFLELSPAYCDGLNYLTTFECLCLESARGVDSNSSALRRWRASPHDVFLDKPCIWIHAVEGQSKAIYEAFDIDCRSFRTITSSKHAGDLIQDACAQLLKIGATYLLWNRADPPHPLG